MGGVREDTIAFDVLVKSLASRPEPDLSNIEQFRPFPEDLERCRRWFVSHGVSVNVTNFGLACTAPRKAVETLFSIRLQPRKGSSDFDIEGTMQVPVEIDDIIKQVTLTKMPDFF